MAETEKLTELTDEMKAAIGTSGPPATYEVAAPGIRMFARAVGYRDPVYYDAEAARAKGHRDVPAPPGFFGSPIFNPTRRAEGGQRAGQFASPFKRNLAGGTEVSPIKTVYAGDVLTAVTTLVSLEIVPSRAYGELMIRISETVYTNQDGEVVAKTRGTGLSY